MQTESDLVDNILYVKNNIDKFNNCRLLARKYFDINDTRKVLSEKYDELRAKYFEN